MKIEKKIVKNGAKLSLAAKSAIAASFGIAAVALTACEESGTAAAPENPDLENHDKKVTDSETPSSSSKVVDIPLSHTAISSSVIEALSSAAEPDYPPQAGVIPPDELYPESSSSSEVNPQSSSSNDELIPPPEAGVVEAPDDIVNSESSSSSVVEAQSSSSEEPESNIVGPIPIVEESSSSEEVKPYYLNEECSDNDPSCMKIHLCTDPKDPSCTLISMVTTFEQDDIIT